MPSFTGFFDFSQSLLENLEDYFLLKVKEREVVWVLDRLSTGYPTLSKQIKSPL
jgi:hypothetical protein